jgi:lincosamide nucleotidyltransferase A/C/D/E
MGQINIFQIDVDFYRTITQSGVELWIDGVWGVDALVGEQTRPYEDLDITIQQKDAPLLRHLISAAILLAHQVLAL